MFMAKYNFEFKKKVVEAYLRGEGGYQILSKKFGLKSTRQIGYWVKAYKKFGDEGLKVLENINVNLKMSKSGNLKMYNFTH